MTTGFWEDTINSNEDCDIPWVPTFSMCNALSRRLNLQSPGPLYIFDWMKSIEIKRASSRWGYDEAEEILYLESRSVDVFSDTLWDQDEGVLSTWGEYWDLEVDIIETMRMLHVKIHDETYEVKSNVLSFVTDFNMPTICM